MENKWKVGKWISNLIFGILLIIIYKMLDNFVSVSSWFNNLFKVLTPFLLGILIAYILYGPQARIEKLFRNIKILRKRAKILSITIVCIITLLIITIIINFILPPISESIIDLINNLPSFYQNTINYLNNQPADSFFNVLNLKDIFSGIMNFDFTKLLDMEKIAGYAKGVFGIASGVLTFFLTIVVSLYLLSDQENIIAFFNKVLRAMFNKNINEKIEKYILETNKIFYKFITSQILDGILVGILTSIVMSLLGVRYAILLGFMIGLFNIIPYFGAIIAVTIAIIITIFTGGIQQAIWMAVTVIVIQQIDANIINPKIVGNSLELSPLLVIFAVTLGGAYFGILGMFLAVPIIAVLKIIVNDYLEFRLEQKKLKEKDITR